MRIIVSYDVRDTYNVPDEKWQEAIAVCNNDEDDAFDFLILKPEEYLEKADVTDRYIEVEAE
jgi:hypothetical protein